jgi:tetraprenyl-beta-curcumene synthase
MTDSRTLQSAVGLRLATGERRHARTQRRSPFRDRRLMARAAFALLLANARYWLVTAPLVRAQLRRWARSARAIGDPQLRSLALQKLDEERFNAEVAAMLATLAPRAQRVNAVRAIVAMEVLYDYLDGLTELPTAQALRDGQQLFLAFTDAVTRSPRHDPDYYCHRPGAGDGGYLEKLVGAVRDALTQLPGTGTIAATVQRAAARCAQAQVREHAAWQVGAGVAEEWARREAASSELQPREFLAGAEASVLAVHALIAAATDRRTTEADAEAIDAVYLSICALTTMLDSLIDYERDMRASKPGYIQRYDDHDQLAAQLVDVARKAATRARHLRNGAHHVMILVGTVAYYTSAPSARCEFARSVKTQIDRELRPLITPTLCILWAWRTAKRVRGRVLDARRARSDRAR